MDGADGLQAAETRVERAEPAALFAAGVLALALTALIETARVPVFERASWFSVALGAYALALRHLLTDLSVAVGLLPALALVAAAGRSLERRWPRAAVLASRARLLLGAAAVAAAFRTLAEYRDFAVFPPVWVAFAALLGFVALAVLPASRLARAPLPPRLQPVLRAGLPAVALAGAVICFTLDALAFKGDYPTLHLSLLQVGHVLLGLGLFHLLRLRRTAAPPVRARGLRVAVACALAAPLGAELVASAAPGTRAYPYWAVHTTLGQTQTVVRPVIEEPGRGDTPVLDPARARALFEMHAGLPDLPEDFELRDYNVLLLMSEATRYDQTSLVPKGPKLTPKLAAFRKRGAYNFRRAYSPSSATLQSLAGIFGMSYPSFVELELWQKPWTGHFKDPRPRPAELFAEAGYDTFWIGHDKASSLSQTVLGVGRGFASQKLLSSKQSRAADADERIANAAVRKLRALARSPRRFFGWVFFVSPHSGYLPHYDDMPADTPLELYRQEVRYLDAQIGRVLRELEALGRLKDTIVIYTADHGEEFRDHGGGYHRSTVYVEVTHVPLLIWLPGQPGRSVEQPTSSAYLFPWLFLHGSPAMKAAAERVLRRDIGPMLERTAGAVVTELLGPHRMLSSLIYDTRKFNYDFSSRLHQAYRLDRDPREQQDLFERDPALAREAIARLSAYRAVRADRRAYVLRPDKTDPRKQRTDD